MKFKGKSFLEKFIDRLRIADYDQIKIVVSNLLKEKEFLGTLINDLPDGIIAVDTDLQIVMANNSAKKFLGISPKAKLENHDIYTVIKYNNVHNLIRDAVSSKTFTGFTEISSKNEKIFLQFSISPRFESELLAGYNIFIRDVSNLKKTEQSSRTAEKWDSLETLTAGLAHDIKNPLNTINIHAKVISNILEQHTNSFLTVNVLEKISKSLNIIDQEGARVNTIVDRLIENSRPVRINLKKVSLNKTIEKVADKFKTEFEIKQIALKLDLDPEVPENPLDEDQIERCLVNLFKNAIEAIESKAKKITHDNNRMKKTGNSSAQIRRDQNTQSALLSQTACSREVFRDKNISFSKYFEQEKDLQHYHGMIVIKTYIKNDFIAMDFQDNGCGIPEENLRKIFDPYFTTKFSGSGLGLMLIQKVIVEHKGQIEISSRINEGTIFSVLLPLINKPIRLLTES